MTMKIILQQNTDTSPAPQAGTEADRHGPGCAWFDGLACDCAG